MFDSHVLRGRALLQERQTRAFGTHARALAEWDRHIFRNRRTLAALETEIKRVAGAQDALERQLSILEVHQSQIHDALEDMEREAMDLYEKEPRRHDEVSRERDALFTMAEDVSKQLVDIGAALRETIQLVRSLDDMPRLRLCSRSAALQVNAQAASSDPAADPLSAAVQILNNQLSSLVWIDSQAKALSRRVDEVQR